jgi:hypothetical protein
VVTENFSAMRLVPLSDPTGFLLFTWRREQKQLPKLSFHIRIKQCIKSREVAVLDIIHRRFKPLELHQLFIADYENILLFILRTVRNPYLQYGQNPAFLDIKLHDACNYHCALKG